MSAMDTDPVDLYGGTEEENTLLAGLDRKVTENPDDFDSWVQIIDTCEKLEGGLTRNSNPQAITATRNFYDRFLRHFPLFFGYWKKYATLEFNIAGTEAAELVFERGVGSVSTSVDLWRDYCQFRVETCHDETRIRELFERGAECVGLDYKSDPFWDCWLQFEERQESSDLDRNIKVMEILRKIMVIPMYSYSKYFERLRATAYIVPLEHAIDSETLATLKAALQAETMSTGIVPPDTEKELRLRIDKYYVDLMNKIAEETLKRHTFEAELRRQYYLVTPLDEVELNAWKKYLDFEEAQGDFKRTMFLYERCLVPAAHEEDLWFRYIRWLSRSAGDITERKEMQVLLENTRHAYQRASCIFVPIAEPAVRLQWAIFEEMMGRPDVSREIYEGILLTLPDHLEAIVSLANLQRRQVGISAAETVYNNYIKSSQTSNATKGALLAEWARLLWKIKGSAEEARQLFKSNFTQYPEVRAFWHAYITFEIEQPSTADTENVAHANIKGAYEAARHHSRLEASDLKEVASLYTSYLMQRGGADAARECIMVDRDINGLARRPQTTATITVR